MKMEIIGKGIVNHLGINAAAILREQCLPQNEQSVRNINIQTVDKKTLRRTSQYTRLLIQAAELALDDAEIDLEQIDRERFGTVINTAYGPLETNLKFAKSVLLGDPDLVSPTVFANTVTNAALGHLCITFGLKGDSTFLMGSNPLKYAAFLLQNNTVDHLLVGALEEYSSDLSHDYTRYYAQNVNYPLSECAASLLVRQVTPNSNALGYVYENYGFSLLQNPYIETIDLVDFEQQLTEVYSEICAKYDDIDLILLGSANNVIEEVERKVLQNHQLYEYTNVKAHIGEVFGANLVASVVLALEMLEQNQNMRKLAIHHLDISMNVSITIVGRD